MSNSSTQTDDQDREDLARVQRRVAEMNVNAARAVDESIGLTNTAHPATSLANTHSALLKTIRQTRQALSYVERTIAASDAEYGTPTPRQITSEHADRMQETYDGPVCNLALMLLEFNRRKWLHEKPETNGAQEVERHGLTANQRDWLNDLQDAWRAYNVD